MAPLLIPRIIVSRRRVSARAETVADNDIHRSALHKSPEYHLATMLFLKLLFVRKKSDHRHRRLLRARCERPRGGRTAEQCDEVAAPHVEHAASLPAIRWLRGSCSRQWRRER
jgi:hypothetical protein